MSHSFQDQTFTAKVITPPKSMYKLGLNGLCHMPGQFYEGRSGKFRHVRREHACATMQVNGRIFIVAAGGRKKSSVELLDTSLPEEGWKLGAYHIPMLV